MSTHNIPDFPPPAYKPYDQNSTDDDRVLTTSENFDHSTKINNNSDNLIYSKEITVHRKTKNIERVNSQKQLVRGDSVKKLKQLDKLESTNVYGSKQSATNDILSMYSENFAPHKTVPARKLDAVTRVNSQRKLVRGDSDRKLRQLDKPGPVKDYDSENITLHKNVSTKKIDAISRVNSQRKLVKGDSIRRLQQFDNFDSENNHNSNVVERQPTTDYVLNSEDVTLHRNASARKLDAITRVNSQRKLERGYSTRKLQQLDKYGPENDYDSNFTSDPNDILNSEEIILNRNASIKKLEAVTRVNSQRKLERAYYTRKLQQLDKYGSESDYDSNFTTDPNDILNYEEIILNRNASIRKLEAVTRANSQRKFANIDSVNELQFPGQNRPLSFYDSNVTARQPFTIYDQFQSWLINDGAKKLFFGLWIFLHILVFFMAFLNYLLNDDLENARKTFGLPYVIARSAALVLHIDAAMILFPVCRNLITLLRATPLNGIIPFDNNLDFHQIIGWSILFFTIVHVVSHWINFYELSKELNGGIGMWFRLNFTTGPGATGYVMLICLIIMVATSIESKRRRHFNRFWYLHHLFIPFFGAWSFHGAFCMIKPDRPPYCNDIAVFWKYWIASGVIYTGERILREIRARQKTFISKVIMHPSRVVEIQIKRENIVTKAGQYIFLCCPEVSPWEWHPFTLTSAPEEDYISIHIRVVGDFTEALAKKLGCDFEEEKFSKKNRDCIKSQIEGIDISAFKKSLPRIMVDGPFGSASEDVFKFEIAILVGAGIGVTPFASVLKTIEEQDIEQFIEIRTYLTGRLRDSEVRNIYTNDGGIKDAVTGLRSPTHYGRPVWDKIFSEMRDQNPATDIGVFFCGPKPIGKQLQEKCNSWSQSFEDGTRFFYGKENF
ncbi:6173_t:CDS:2 [Dentiscutata erythropus]|uniref:6173_t:CDS:1 n=1 Tax=Dentiscutata erythropus TaxID=1348616 RepID=A0A9N8ZEZ0_9GLOM|nr:6173_t:CDS:2 [Dentiscutata erythropus]